jgi:hypothetical protein
LSDRIDGDLIVAIRSVAPPEHDRSDPHSPAGLPIAVDVGAVLDSQDGHSLRLVIDLVDDPVRPSASGPQPREFALEGMASAAGFLDEGTDHELDDRCGDLGGQPI